MPMNFPDMDSLKGRATQRGFREPRENESEEQYREEFADFMFDVDPVESGEIRHKDGWNEWGDGQKMDLLARMMMERYQG